MIGRFIEELRKEGIDISLEELGDILWLSQVLPRADRPPSTLPQQTLSKPDQHPREEFKHRDIRPESEAQSERRGEKHQAERAKEGAKEGLSPASTTLHLPSRTAGTGSAAASLPLATPAAAALPGAMEIIRALRPLRRRVPSRRVLVLDEEATARRIHEEQSRVPVLRPGRERWLDLALVIDEAASMAIWRRTIGEFKILLERLGAFRDVRVWGLDTEGPSVRLRSGLIEQGERTVHSPGEIVDPTGRRLILVVTDGVAPAWRSGAVLQTLTRWGRASPTAIIDVLPDYLRIGTVIGESPGVRLWTRQAGLANGRFEVERPKRRRTLPAGMGFPVVALDPVELGSLARFAAGDLNRVLAGIWIDGQIGAGAAPPVLSSQVAPAELDGATRLKRFDAVASPLAQHLVRLLAAAPLSLPVIRLIREVMLPSATQSHLAEVFLGGLLDEVIPTGSRPPPDEVEYDFRPGVREELLRTLPVSETLAVLRRVSQFIGDRVGTPINFPALLADPDASAPGLGSPRSRAFAEVAAFVLKALGGRYSKLAERLERSTAPRVGHLNSLGSFTEARAQLLRALQSPHHNLLRVLCARTQVGVEPNRAPPLVERACALVHGLKHLSVGFRVGKQRLVTVEIHLEGLNPGSAVEVSIGDKRFLASVLAVDWFGGAALLACADLPDDMPILELGETLSVGDEAVSFGYWNSEPGSGRSYSDQIERLYAQERTHPPGFRLRGLPKAERPDIYQGAPLMVQGRVAGIITGGTLVSGSGERFAFSGHSVRWLRELVYPTPIHPNGRSVLVIGPESSHRSKFDEAMCRALGRGLALAGFQLIVRGADGGESAVLNSFLGTVVAAGAELDQHLRYYTQDGVHLGGLPSHLDVGGFESALARADAVIVLVGDAPWTESWKVVKQRKSLVLLLPATREADAPFVKEALSIPEMKEIVGDRLLEEWGRPIESRLQAETRANDAIDIVASHLPTQSQGQGTRELLDAEARLYEEIRRTLTERSDVRTAAMDRVLATVRVLPGLNELEQHDIEALLSSKAPGKRVVGLAICEVISPAPYLTQVIEILLARTSRFEEYHALSVAQRLVAGLDSRQAERLAVALLETRNRPGGLISEQASRRFGLVEQTLWALAQRLLLVPRADWKRPDSNLDRRAFAIQGLESWIAAGPQKNWGSSRCVAVIGSDYAKGSSTFCSALGKALASHGWQVVTGGGTGVGPEVAKGYFLVRSDPARITLFLRHNSSQAQFVADEPFVKRVGTLEQVRDAMFASATHAVVIGGAEGTKSEVEIAQEKGISILPMKVSGGTAARLAKEEDENQQKLVEAGLPNPLWFRLNAPELSEEERAEAAVRALNMLPGLDTARAARSKKKSPSPAPSQLQEAARAFLKILAGLDRIAPGESARIPSVWREVVELFWPVAALDSPLPTTLDANSIWTALGEQESIRFGPDWLLNLKNARSRICTPELSGLMSVAFSILNEQAPTNSRLAILIREDLAEALLTVTQYEALGRIGEAIQSEREPFRSELTARLISVVARHPELPEGLETWLSRIGGFGRLEFVVKYQIQTRGRGQLSPSLMEGLDEVHDGDFEHWMNQALAAESDREGTLGEFWKQANPILRAAAYRLLGESTRPSPEVRILDGLSHELERAQSRLQGLARISPDASLAPLRSLLGALLQANRRRIPWMHSAVIEKLAELCRLCARTTLGVVTDAPWLECAGLAALLVQEAGLGQRVGLRPCRVLLVDDGTSGVDPRGVVERANSIQSHYGFSWLPVDVLGQGSPGVPEQLANAIKPLFPSQPPHFALFEAEKALFRVKNRFHTENLLLVTGRPVAASESGTTVASWRFSGSTLQEPRVGATSSEGLEAIAAEAGTSKEEALLKICLAQLLDADPHLGLDFHDETVGCLLDRCRVRAERAQGLRSTTFGHASCRARVRDARHLQALDVLCGLTSQRAASGAEPAAPAPSPSASQSDEPPTTFLRFGLVQRESARHTALESIGQLEVARRLSLLRLLQTGHQATAEDAEGVARWVATKVRPFALWEGRDRGAEAFTSRQVAADLVRWVSELGLEVVIGAGSAGDVELSLKRNRVADLERVVRNHLVHPGSAGEMPVLEALEQLADLSIRRAAHLQAIDYLALEVELRQSSRSDIKGEVDTQGLAATLVRLGSTQYKARQYAAAEESLTRAIALLDRVSDGSPADDDTKELVFTAILRLGDVQLAHRKLRKAEEVLQRADKLVGTGSSPAALAQRIHVTRRWAALALAQGRVADAEKAFREGEGTARQLLAAEPRSPGAALDAADFLTACANFQVGRANPRAAIDLLKEIIEIRKAIRVAAPNHFENVSELDFAWTSLSDAYYQAGQHEQALRALDEELALLDEIEARTGVTPATRKSRSAAWMKQGDASMTLRQTAEALELLDRALAEAEREPRLVDADDLVAVIQQKRSDAHRLLGNLDQALRAQEISTDASEAWLERNRHDDRARRMNMIALARLGVLRAITNQGEQGLRDISAAVEYFEDRCRTRPSDVLASQDLAGTLMQQAEALEALGQVEAALMSWQAARARWADLVRSPASVASWPDFMGRCDERIRALTHSSPASKPEGREEPTTDPWAALPHWFRSSPILRRRATTELRRLVGTGATPPVPVLDTLVECIVRAEVPDDEAVELLRLLVEPDLNTHEHHALELVKALLAGKLEGKRDTALRLAYTALDLRGGVERFLTWLEQGGRTGAALSVSFSALYLLADRIAQGKKTGWEDSVSRLEAVCRLYPEEREAQRLFKKLTGEELRPKPGTKASATPLGEGFGTGTRSPNALVEPVEAGSTFDPSITVTYWLSARPLTSPMAHRNEYAETLNSVRVGYRLGPQSMRWPMCQQSGPLRVAADGDLVLSAKWSEARNLTQGEELRISEEGILRFGHSIEWASDVVVVRIEDLAINVVGFLSYCRAFFQELQKRTSTSVQAWDLTAVLTVPTRGRGATHLFSPNGFAQPQSRFRTGFLRHSPVESRVRLDVARTSGLAFEVAAIRIINGLVGEFVFDANDSQAAAGSLPMQSVQEEGIRSLVKSFGAP